MAIVAKTLYSNFSGSALRLCADRTLYAVHPIPLSEVKAIRKHAPSFGTQHLVLVLSNGLTLPPLYFTNGGVKGLFSALREVCHLCLDTSWFLK